MSYKKGKFGHQDRDTLRENHVRHRGKMTTGLKSMLRSRPSEAPSPANTFILDFQPPELWDSKFLLSKPPSLWCCEIQQPWETNAFPLSERKATENSCGYFGFTLSKHIHSQFFQRIITSHDSLGPKGATHPIWQMRKLRSRGRELTIRPTQLTTKPRLKPRPPH